MGFLMSSCEGCLGGEVVVIYLQTRSSYHQPSLPLREWGRDPGLQDSSHCELLEGNGRVLWMLILQYCAQRVISFQGAFAKMAELMNQFLDECTSVYTPSAAVVSLW